MHDNVFWGINCSQFCEANPRCSLCDVYFVDIKDKTVDCFKKEIARKVEKKSKLKAVNQLAVKINETNVEVVQGSIEDETTDAIVTSTTASLAMSKIPVLHVVHVATCLIYFLSGINAFEMIVMLSGSSVTKAILMKSGTSVEQECRKMGRVNDRGFLVTGAGNLSCHKIFHVNVPTADPERLTW